MKTSFRPGTIRGVPVEIHYSWLAIFLLAAAALATYVLPALRPSWSTAAFWVIGLCTSFLFFASLLAHELAHSVVATREGIMVRGVTLFILGSATRLAQEPASPRAEMVVAASGPLTSVALAMMFAALWLLGDNVSEHVGAAGLYLFSINLVVAALDVIPALPLDGGRVVRSIVWQRTGDYDRATRVAVRIGQTLGAALVAAGFAIGVFVFWYSGVFVAFLGLFLLAASRVSRRQATLRRRLRGLTARDIMDTPVAVPAEATLEELASDPSLGAGDRCLLVGSPGAAEGVVCPDQIEDVPKRRWGATPAADIMIPIGRIGAVDPDESGLSVLERMEETRAELLAVVSDGEVGGVIRREYVLELGRPARRSGS